MQTTATHKWTTAINVLIRSGMTKDEARKKANAENPGLRAAYLKENGYTPEGSLSGSRSVTPQASARQRWEASIDRFKCQGLNHSDAIKAANKLNPGLREQVVAEANNRRFVPRPIKKPAAKNWDAKVSQIMADGHSRMEATRIAGKRFPALRAQMITEANQDQFS